MPSEVLMEKYRELHELYGESDQVDLLKEIEEKMLDGKEDWAEILMSKLKTKEELVEELEKKLVGKPVWKTLKKIHQNKVDNKYQFMKGLSSLLTHALIEVEAGEMQYFPIAKELYERLGDVING